MHRYAPQIRRMPKPVVAMVAGYAVGGGHILHMMCDLTIAADNAVFGQTGPKVGSFDAGYGSTQVCCALLSWGGRGAGHASLRAWQAGSAQRVEQWGLRWGPWATAGLFRLVHRL